VAPTLVEAKYNMDNNNLQQFEEQYTQITMTHQYIKQIIYHLSS
jgi:hypothetical protein